VITLVGICTTRIGPTRDSPGRHLERSTALELHDGDGLSHEPDGRTDLVVAVAVTGSGSR
jgi:hypothetical protein